MSAKPCEQHIGGTGNRQLEIEYTPDICHELNELYKLCSNQRNTHSRKIGHVASPKQIPGDQSVCALPAPERFTRKTRPDASKRLARNARQSESPTRSAQQSCDSNTERFDDSYDALLQRLMYHKFSFHSSVTKKSGWAAVQRSDELSLNLSSFANNLLRNLSI